MPKWKLALWWIAFLVMIYAANFTPLGAVWEWLGPQGITKLAQAIW